jgi:hypothetical protein
VSRIVEELGILSMGDIRKNGMNNYKNTWIRIRKYLLMGGR